MAAVRSAVRSWPIVAIVVGVALVLAGTFAPWLASGSTTRNVYGAAGVGERLLGLSGGAALAVNAVPYLSLVYASAALLWSLGRGVSAGALVLVATVIVAGACVAALRAPRANAVHVVTTGPLITLVGALIILGAMIVQLVRLGRRAAVCAHNGR